MNPSIAEEERTSPLVTFDDQELDSPEPMENEFLDDEYIHADLGTKNEVNPDLGENLVLL